MKISRSMAAVVITLFMLSFSATPELWAEGNNPPPTVQPPPNMNNQPTLSGNQPPQTGSAAPPPIGSLPSVDEFQAGEKGALQAVSTAEAVVNTTTSQPNSDQNLDDLYNAMLAAIAEADAAEKAFSDATAASDAAQAAVLSSQQAVDAARVVLASARSAESAAQSAYDSASITYGQFYSAIVMLDSYVVAAGRTLDEARAGSDQAHERVEANEREMNQSLAHLADANRRVEDANAAINSLPPDADPEERRWLQAVLDDANADAREARSAYTINERLYKETLEHARIFDEIAEGAGKAYGTALDDAFKANADSQAALNALAVARHELGNATENLEAAQSELDQDLIDLNYAQNEADRLREEGHAAYEAWNDASQRAADAIKAYNDALAGNP